MKMYIKLILMLLLLSSCKESDIAESVFTTDGFLYYYETQLNDKQKEMYQKVLAGLLSLQEEFDVPFGSVDEYLKIFTYIRKDHPILFYTNRFTLRTFSNPQRAVFIPQYINNKNYIERRINDVHNYLKRFDHIKDKSDLEKLTYVYTYFTRTYTYDHSFRDYSYHILGPIVNKTAVCDGIARTMKLILDYLNVKCIYVTGRMINPPPNMPNDNHAWNIVNIDGNFFHIDATWDLPERGKTTDYFRNFMLTDSQIRRTRIIESRAPRCNTYGRDYFSMNNMIVRNLNEFRNFATNRLEQGNKRIIVKFENMTFSQRLYDQILEIARQQYLEIFNSVASTQTTHFAEDMIFDITLTTHGKDYNALNIKVVNNMTEFRDYVNQSLKENKHQLYVRFRNMSFSQGFTDQMREIIRQEYLEIHNSIASIRTQHYAEQMIFEITIERQGKDYNALNIKVIDNMEEYKNHVERLVRDNNRNIVVRFRNMTFSQAFYDEITQIAMQKYREINNRAVSISVEFFREQMIFEIRFN